MCVCFTFTLKANKPPENAVPIETWIDDQADEALLDLLPFLDALRFTKVCFGVYVFGGFHLNLCLLLIPMQDVRSVLSLRPPFMG